MIVKEPAIQPLPELRAEPPTGGRLGGKHVHHLILTASLLCFKNLFHRKIADRRYLQRTGNVTEIGLGQLIFCRPRREDDGVMLMLTEEAGSPSMQLDELAVRQIILRCEAVRRVEEKRPPQTNDDCRCRPLPTPAPPAPSGHAADDHPRGHRQPI